MRLDPDSDYAFDSLNPPDPKHIVELRKARGVIPDSAGLVDRSSTAPVFAGVSPVTAPACEVSGVEAAAAIENAFRRLMRGL